MKRLFGVMTLIAMLSVLLAACGGQPTTTPAEEPAAEATEAPAAEPAEPTEESTEATEEPVAEATEVTEEPAADPVEDPLGVVEVAPGDSIILAYAQVISGPNETLGVDSIRGVELAMDAFGGELLGHPLELVGEDSLCSPEGGQAAATKLASNPQIVGIIGTTCSSAATVAAPIIDEAGMVMISGSNTAPALTDPAEHVQGFLRTAHNDKVQGAVAAEYAFNVLGVTTAATIHDGSVYAEQLANVFAERFTELGGQIVAQEAVNAGDTDMRSVLTSIASDSPELIYYPIFVAEGGFVTSQVGEVSGLEGVKLMASDGLFSPDFIDAAGDAAVGMYLSSPDFSAFAGGYEDFLAKHEERYGEDPLSVFHANAYDASTLILNAVEQVAVEQDDGTLLIPRQALRDAIYATADFAGLTGNLTCDENGDCADPNIAVYEVVSGDSSLWQDEVVQKVYP